MRPQIVLGSLVPVFAVATLPLGILAGLFLGLTPAIVVFVVGWLLLTPLSAILAGAGHANHAGGWVEEEVEEVVQERTRERVEGSLDGSSSKDPVEELRERYARGEIDEVELERRLDALLETEDVDSDDEETIQRAIDNLDTGHGRDTGSTRTASRPAETDPEDERVTERE